MGLCSFIFKVTSLLIKMTNLKYLNPLLRGIQASFFDKLSTNKRFLGKMVTCKLCGFRKQLIKAHIISRKLYEPIREASSDKSLREQIPYIYKVGTEQKPNQAQSGIYDSSLLCKECDGNLIGPWDKYGQALLLRPPDSEKYIFDATGKPIFYKVETFDYKQLKLFFMSILWRAAITNDEFFSQVQLDPWEKELKKMILEQDPGDENAFSVILLKYEGVFSEITCNPMKAMQDEVNFYRFRFPGYGFLIKVDQKNILSELNLYLLSATQPLLMRVIEYSNSQEYKKILGLEEQIPN